MVDPKCLEFGTYSVLGRDSSSFLTTQNPKMLRTLGQWHLNLRGPFATRPSALGSTVSPTHTVSGLHYYCVHLFRSVSNWKGLWAIYKDMLNKKRWSPAPPTPTSPPPPPPRRLRSKARKKMRVGQNAQLGLRLQGALR